MTSRAKRLTLILGEVALVAVVAGSLIAPEPVAAAKEKPTRDFVIKTTEDWKCDMSRGTFVATGAIESSGSLWGDLCPLYYGIHLSDSTGHISIRITTGKHGAFEIVYADGAYVGLVGVTGSYREESTWDLDENGHPLGTVSRTLEGKVPK